MRPLSLYLAALSLLLAGCATPGLEYNAERAPGNLAAAAYRSVAVEAFEGPYAGWYKEEFEGMLKAASFNGTPWFAVGFSPQQSNVEAVYGGRIELSYPEVYESYFTRSDCLRRDENDACIQKREVEHVCVDYRITALAQPYLIVRETGQQLHAATYYGHGQARECFETGYVRYRVSRDGKLQTSSSYGFWEQAFLSQGFGRGGDDLIERIAADALRQTIRQARFDIAPYNQKAKATIATRPADRELASDPRFKAALNATRQNDIRAACDLFHELTDAYPESPALVHNRGACAEAGGDMQSAMEYYSDALVLTDALPASPQKKMLASFMRAAKQRQEASALEYLFPKASEDSYID